MRLERALERDTLGELDPPCRTVVRRRSQRFDHLGSADGERNRFAAPDRTQGRNHRVIANEDCPAAIDEERRRRQGANHRSQLWVDHEGYA